MEPHPKPRLVLPGIVRWALLTTALFLVVLGAATLGAPVPLADLWAHNTARAEVARQIFLELRPPRLLAGALVGAALAASGAAMQAVFRNPLAEPYLLGVSAGGALGATIGLALQEKAAGLAGGVRGAAGGFDLATMLAFGGALGASALVYVLGQRRTGSTINRSGGFERGALLLTGVALSAFLSSLMALVVALGSRDDLARQVMFWTLGGLAPATPAHNTVLAAALATGLLMLMASARDLNALRVGDEEALGLGVAVGALHRRLLLAAALMSAAAVAAAGLIGFVGLLAPHLMRTLFGSDARALVPASALGGATQLVGCDAMARSVAQPREIPVGIVTALLGVPLFLFLSRKS